MDIIALAHTSFSPEELNYRKTNNCIQTGLYLHPIFHKDGNYPQIVIDRIAKRSELEGFRKSRLPSFTSEEINLIRNSADFLGVNHYTTNISKAISEPEIGAPYYHYDKGYAEYQNESWSGSASTWLKACSCYFKNFD